MKRHLLIRILVLAAIPCALGVGLGGCTTGGSGHFSQDVVELPAQSFERTWTADLELKGTSLRELHVRDQAIFAYTSDNTSIALVRTGGQIAHIDSVHSIGRLRPPIVLKDRVVYPTNTKLEVYNQSGKFEKSVDVDAAIRSAGVGEGNHVYIGTDSGAGGRLTAMDIDRPYGTPIWQLMTFGGVSATPAIVQSIVYAGSEDGNVYAVSETRAAVWPLPGGVYKTGGRIVADVVADEFGVFVASMDSKLVCLRRGDGYRRWQYFAGVPLTVAPVVTPDTVYQFVSDKGIVALDKTDVGDEKDPKYNKQPMWIASGAKQFLSQDEHYAYLRRNDNRIVAVDRKTGEAKFTSDRAYDIFGVNNKGDGIIYAATKAGVVFAIKPILQAGQSGLMAFIATPVDADATRVN